MTASSTRRVLIVGYGNPLRGDDGAGPAVAELLLEGARLPGVDIRVEHQLAPELARDFAEASLVVLVDASTEVAPGSVDVRRHAASDVGPAASSHHVDPAALVALACELFGAAPPVFTISVGAGPMEAGDALSPAVVEAIPRAADRVVGIVETHARA